MGYPEGGGDHVIIALNGVWVGTVVNAQAAESLAEFMSTMAAVPAENFGFESVEEVQRAVSARAPGAQTQQPPA